SLSVGQIHFSVAIFPFACCSLQLSLLDPPFSRMAVQVVVASGATVAAARPLGDGSVTNGLRPSLRLLQLGA
ncbi:unnamed protein product, partial [Urochloa humidicola]